MSRINYLLLVLGVLLIVGCESPSPPKVLVFSKTAGYRHASIEPAKQALMELGTANGFVVDTTEDAKLINEAHLQAYAAVIFLSTTGDVLDHSQEADLERYIQAGRGFVGIHAASDTEFHWAWYNRLVGGYFANHPKIQEADVHRVDSTHLSTTHLPNIWTRTDEWYNFKKYQDDLNLLLWVDEDSYEGGQMEREHPIAWYHAYDGGRAWYTAMGHTEESYTEAEFMQHLLGGIQYAIGENKPYHWEGIHTERVPEADRFEKTMLVEGQLFEPTEMTVLPNLDLIVVERRGGVLHYDADRKQIRKVAEIPVYHKAEVPHVNAEEGLMGIQAAPNFAETGHIYLFYSPADTSVNRLSRFVWQGDSLDLASETIVLQFHSDRNICCHTGGSIAFSGDGRYLYLSTGDNATPFDEKGERYQNKGFAPLDQRPGHEQYDARRTSGNTNDLRGKVLRLEVQADGNYRIPAGNLFPEGTPNTRPEIYVMGTRNPYRISIDSRRGHLYWGDVGPDAKGDEWELRGPRGYDEINQARSAGYFGWPLFVGNNFAYHEFDYSNGRSGGTFDPAAPRNTSRNNTGLEELPPAQPAFIWYPYAPSKDFPQLEEGGRNAMAGPVYYSEDYPEETRLPAYFDGNLIIYDWIRNWVKLVHLNEAGDFEKMDPLFADHDFNNIIDMELGPDGRLYLLEYGSGWFSRNPDAGIARIDYLSGNRPPKINAVEVAATSGKLPFQVEATVDASDPEGETMTYHWQVGYETYTTTEPQLSITLDEAGDYPLSCRVEDASGATRASEQQLLYAGNAAPQISIAVAGNPQMFFRGEPLAYKVEVTDEDTVDWSRLLVQPTYKSKGQPASGHLAGSGLQAGEDIIAQLDCASCHRNDTVSIGPSYVAIATRYATAPDAITYLGEKIIKGGNGAWGEQAMAPHPGVSTAEAQQIAEWILAKVSSGQEVESLPAKGSFLTDAETRRAYLHLQASYTDVPAEGIKPLTTQVSKVLYDNHFNFGEIQQGEGVVRAVYNGRDTWAINNSRAWLRLDSVNLNRVGEWAVLLAWNEGIPEDYQLELREASPEGKVLAKVTSTAMSRRGRQQQTLSAPLEDGAAEARNLYVVVNRSEVTEPAQMLYLQGVQFFPEK